MKCDPFWTRYMEIFLILIQTSKHSHRNIEYFLNLQRGKQNCTSYFMAKFRLIILENAVSLKDLNKMMSFRFTQSTSFVIRAIWIEENLLFFLKNVQVHVLTYRKYGNI